MNGDDSRLLGSEIPGLACYCLSSSSAVADSCRLPGVYCLYGFGVGDILLFACPWKRISTQLQILGLMAGLLGARGPFETWLYPEATLWPKPSPSWFVRLGVNSRGQIPRVVWGLELDTATKSPFSALASPFLGVPRDCTGVF